MMREKRGEGMGRGRRYKEEILGKSKIGGGSRE